MKTLKELNKTCTLISEYKQFAFIGYEGSVVSHNHPIKVAIYYGNKTFYVCMKITKSIIYEYDSFDSASDKFLRLIHILLNK